VRPRLVLPTTITAAALFLGACSSTDHSGMNMGSGASTGPGGSGAPSTKLNIPADAAFNATDVGFAQGMIPHHGQAVEMADLALATSSNPEIKKIAEQIKAAQSPEIEKMSGWLKSWNQTVPDPKMKMDATMEHPGGMAMSGMMSEADMARLGNGTGTQFDRMFLEMMVLHHEGAVEMAKKEVADGKYQPTKDLAQAVIKGQEAEIIEMNAMLKSLPA